MQYLVDNFASVANLYAQIVISAALFLVGMLLGYFLKPFTQRPSAAYLPALFYGTAQIVTSFIETGKLSAGLISLGILVLSFFLAWLSDHKRNPVQKIFLLVTFRLISWLSMEALTEIGLFEGQFIVKLDWYMNNINVIVIEFFIWNFLQYALMVLLLYLFIKILHKAYKRKSDELTWQELTMLLTPVATLLLVKPIMASYFRLWMDGIENESIKENVPGNPYRLLFSLLSFFPILIVVMLYQKLRENREEEFARRAVEDQIRDTHRHVGHIEDLYEKMRALRHDIGNHLTVIEGLARSGKTEELAGYTNELHERFDKLQPAVKTGNAVTDIVLSEIHDTCEKSGITFESRFGYPAELKINPFDMSVILTNALQNAIEAAQKTESPKIMISSVLKERFFIIRVRNTIRQKVLINEDGLSDSTKPESGHGYGLKNIRSIAQKYQGDLEILQEESDGILFFILNIMLLG